VTAFSRRFEVRWSDLDMNAHMRSTAYADYAIDVRNAFLSGHGFGFEEYARRGFGPVLLHEEARYFREVRPGDSIEVDLRAAGLAPDGTRWKVEHQVRRSDGKRAAVLRIEGVWLDLGTRRPVPPPAELLDALRQLDRTDDFEEMEPVEPRS
jgi:acyl-CoA thioester hydrolase